MLAFFVADITFGALHQRLLQAEGGSKDGGHHHRRYDHCYHLRNQFVTILRPLEVKTASQSLARFCSGRWWFFNITVTLNARRDVKRQKMWPSPSLTAIVLPTLPPSQQGRHRVADIRQSRQTSAQSNTHGDKKQKTQENTRTEDTVLVALLRSPEALVLGIHETFVRRRAIWQTGNHGGV